MEQTSVTIRAVEQVGPDAIALELETPDGFDARPGQFVKLSATVDGELISRFYTISSPRVGETFETTLSIDPTGTFGPYLASLEAGDTIRVTGPFGNAYYEDEPRTLVVAGGPGVGPAVGIAERTLDDGGEAAVVYLDSAPLHEERLSMLANRGATVIVVGDAAAVTPGIEEALVADAQAFVYGFSEFLDVATDALSAAGADTEAAKIENFGPAPEVDS